MASIFALAFLSLCRGAECSQLLKWSVLDSCIISYILGIFKSILLGSLSIVQKWRILGCCVLNPGELVRIVFMEAK